jgi:hypothetical protein
MKSFLAGAARRDLQSNDPAAREFRAGVAGFPAIAHF